MKTKLILVAILGVTALLFAGFFINNDSASKPKVLSPTETLAQCLTDSGTKFFGAFWCPHCQNQKQLFGRSAAPLLPYVECSTKNGQEQLPICIENNIESYPTWTFPSDIVIESDVVPVVCTQEPLVDENPLCATSRSKFFKVWVFPNLRVASVSEPVISDSTWQFTNEAQVRGELPFEFLEKQSGCVAQ